MAEKFTRKIAQGKILVKLTFVAAAAVFTDLAVTI